MTTEATVGGHVRLNAGLAMIGPLCCGTCGTWPAMHCEQGPRCHICELRDFAAANPVPLPSSVEALRDLASVGVAAAQEKLDTMANAPAHAKTGPEKT